VIFYCRPLLWSVHGETVPRSVPFIPSSFGCAPRDHSKRLNSGYKAWEFQIYVYGLCPTLLCHLLPQQYWHNFCRLVARICILQHPCISKEELLLGHDLLMLFAQEFEELYYQHKESWIHFICQSIHLLTHIANKTFHVGPLVCYAQWTLETAIGNLGQEIQQDLQIWPSMQSCMHKLNPCRPVFQISNLTWETTMQPPCLLGHACSIDMLGMHFSCAVSHTHCLLQKRKAMP
jgi:hypothetical protein